MTKDDVQAITQNLLSELRRGTLVLSVLSQLSEQQYGYSLKQCLAEEGIEIDQGTLYPLLRRLEKQGLLESDWMVEENRPRRYYRLNETGVGVLEELTAEWTQMGATIDRLLSKRA
jgi:PadR family transcriptional regulator, regulatory protein PadR